MAQKDIPKSRYRSPVLYIAYYGISDLSTEGKQKRFPSLLLNNVNIVVFPVNIIK